MAEPPPLPPSPRVLAYEPHKPPSSGRWFPALIRRVPPPLLWVDLILAVIGSPFGACPIAIVGSSVLNNSTPGLALFAVMIPFLPLVMTTVVIGLTVFSEDRSIAGILRLILFLNATTIVFGCIALFA